MLEEEMRRRKIKEMNAQQNAGYSFGLKISLDSNFKENRRTKNLSIKKSLENIFDVENITMAKPNKRVFNQSNSGESIRNILQGKKEYLQGIRRQKRERKTNKVKKNLEEISIEKMKKDDTIKAKYKLDQYEKSLSKSRGRNEKGLFGVTIDNYNEYSDESYEDIDKAVEESYMSERGLENDRKRQFLSEKYKIQLHNIRNVSKKKKEEYEIPGPGILLNE